MKKARRRAPAPLSAGERRRLMRAARAALRRSYARYSKFRVGAAILTQRGALYSGCNVENASYGLTNCAERTAIHSAVAAEGKGFKGLRVRAVAVVNGQELPCSPCGACRQVIFEFGPEAVVLFKTAAGWKQSSITDLLPYSFRF